MSSRVSNVLAKGFWLAYFFVQSQSKRMVNALIKDQTPFLQRTLLCSSSMAIHQALLILILTAAFPQQLSHHLINLGASKKEETHILLQSNSSITSYHTWPSILTRAGRKPASYFLSFLEAKAEQVINFFLFTQPGTVCKILSDFLYHSMPAWKIYAISQSLCVSIATIQAAWNVNTEDHDRKLVNCKNCGFNPFCYTYFFKNLFSTHKGQSSKRVLRGWLFHCYCHESASHQITEPLLALNTLLISYKEGYLVQFLHWAEANWWEEL